jgi:hypothetical protein
VTMKNAVFWDVTPVTLVRTDVSEEPSASFIRITRIGELGTLAVTSNRRRLRSRPTTSQKYGRAVIEPGTSESVAKNSDH